MTKNAIFYIGLPGSGKSTDIEKLNVLGDFKVISADKLKENHPDYDPNKAEELHEWSVRKAKDQVIQTLFNGKNFIFDSGGINNSYSFGILTLAKNAGYHITLRYMNTPIQICLERISQRERKVPFLDIFNKSFKIHKCLEEQKKLVDAFVEIPYYKDDNFVFDMDGVLVEYQVFPLKCKYAPENLKVDHINNNIFEFARPVKTIVNIVNKLIENNKKVFILSVSPNNHTNRQKLEWLRKYIPKLDPMNIYFVGNIDNKLTTLEQLLVKHKITKQNTVYVDDIHSLLWQASNTNFNAMHPSTFLSTYEQN